MKPHALEAAVAGIPAYVRAYLGTHEATCSQSGSLKEARGVAEAQLRLWPLLASGTPLREAIKAYMRRTSSFF
jgi:hypothetical protein